MKKLIISCTGYEIPAILHCKAALVLSIVSQVNSVCQEDAQCPGDQVCLLEKLHNTARIVNKEKDFKVEVKGLIYLA